MQSGDPDPDQIRFRWREADRRMMIFAVTVRQEQVAPGVSQSRRSKIFSRFLSQFRFRRLFSESVSRAN